MAKSIYKESTIIELSGTLDDNSEGDLVVFVEEKDAPPVEHDIISLLEAHKGKQLMLKLVDEQVM